MRTTAVTRPAEETYSLLEAVEELVRRGFPRDHAVRVVAIAQAFGIKGECIPGGGVVTLKAKGGRIALHDKLFI